MSAVKDTLIGTVVDGRFEIRDKLGQGGMGAVYRAWQRSVDREIAIKLIAKTQTVEPMAIERFLREAKLASQLSHPNTISVYDFGTLADGRLFIAMELLKGQTLGRELKTKGALAFDRIIRIGIQICDALAAAHALKIVHRDLKPDNVMLIDNTADLVKVLDFGLAKRLDDRSLKGTAAGIVVGTPRYIPPEALMTGITYPEGDLYALGVMIGEMALGRPLWPGSDLADLLTLQMKPAEHIRDIPEPLHGIVASLLDPTPAMRPTALQLRGLLISLQSGALPRGRPPTADVPARSPWARPVGHDEQPTAPRRKPPTAEPPRSARPVLYGAPSPDVSTQRSARAPDAAKPTRPRWPLYAAAAGTLLIATIVFGIVAKSSNSKTAVQSPPSTPQKKGSNDPWETKGSATVKGAEDQAVSPFGDEPEAATDDVDVAPVDQGAPLAKTTGHADPKPKTSKTPPTAHAHAATPVKKPTTKKPPCETCLEMPD